MVIFWTHVNKLAEFLDEFPEGHAVIETGITGHCLHLYLRNLEDGLTLTEKQKREEQGFRLDVFI